MTYQVIRRFLSIEATKTLVSAHILSRLDYCNGILINSTQDTIHRLQKLQYNAARLILRVPRREHMTPHLFKLHWLPVDARIKYKIACLSYRAFHGVGPVYLSDLVQIHVPARVTRSASDKFTLEPRLVSDSIRFQIGLTQDLQTSTWIRNCVWNTMHCRILYQTPNLVHVYRKNFHDSL